MDTQQRHPLLLLAIKFSCSIPFSAISRVVITCELYQRLLTWCNNLEMRCLMSVCVAAFMLPAGSTKAICGYVARSFVTAFWSFHSIHQMRVYRSHSIHISVTCFCLHTCKYRQERVFTSFDCLKRWWRLTTKNYLCGLRFCLCARARSSSSLTQHHCTCTSVCSCDRWHATMSKR